MLNFILFCIGAGFVLIIPEALSAINEEVRRYQREAKLERDLAAIRARYQKDQP